MAINGQARIVGGANFAQITQAMNALQNQLTGISNSFSGITGAAKTALGAFLAFQGVGSILGGIKQQIDMADELGKLAQKVGVGVEELSKFQLAAELSDVSNEQLAQSFGKLAEKINQARVSTTDAAKDFKKFGVDVLDLKGNLRSTTDVFLDLADVVSGFKNDAAKISAVKDIFGKTGQDLLPLLNSGKQQIQETIELAEKLGLVVSDSYTNLAQSLNDNLTILNRGFNSLFATIAQAVTPAIVVLQQALIDVISSGSLLDKQQQAIANQKTILKYLIDVAGTVDEVVFVLSKFVKALEVVGITAKLILTPVAGAFVVLGKIVTETFNLIFKQAQSFVNIFKNIGDLSKEGLLKAGEELKNFAGKNLFNSLVSIGEKGNEIVEVFSGIGKDSVNSLIKSINEGFDSKNGRLNLRESLLKQFNLGANATDSEIDLGIDKFLEKFKNASQIGLNSAPLLSSIKAQRDSLSDEIKQAIDQILKVANDGKTKIEDALFDLDLSKKLSNISEQDYIKQKIDLVNQEKEVTINSINDQIKALEALFLVEQKKSATDKELYAITQKITDLTLKAKEETTNYTRELKDLDAQSKLALRDYNNRLEDLNQQLRELKDNSAETQVIKIELDAKRLQDQLIDPALVNKVTEIKQAQIDKVFQTFNNKVRDLDQQILSITNPAEARKIQLEIDKQNLKDQLNDPALFGKVDELFNAKNQELQRQLQKEADQFSGQILDLQGKTKEASQLALELEINDLIRNLPDQKEKIEIYKQLKLQMIEITEQEKQFNKVITEQKLLEDDLNSIKNAGNISELSYLADLRNLRQENVEQIKKEYEALIQLYNQTGQQDALLKAKELQNQLKDLERNIDPLAQKVDEIFTDKLGDAINNLIDGTKSLKDSFKDLFDSILQEFQKLIVQDLSKKLYSSLFGSGEAGGASGLGSALSGLFGGSGGASGTGGTDNFGNIVAGLGSLFGGFFANGGNLKPNTFSIVGENGPEVMFNKNGGSIISNTQSKELLANAGTSNNQNYNINVSIYANNPQEFQKSEGQLAATIRNAAARGSRNT